MAVRAQPDNDPPPDAAAAEAPRHAFIVPVPLPITGTIDIQIQRMIDQRLESLPRGEGRPVMVLEFRPKAGQQGEGTQLERAKSLARYLVSPKLSSVRTVAWLPKSVRGHAVLPVLACEEIMMSPEATLGDAGYDVDHVDADTLSDYEFIARQRRTIPMAVVQGMLDKELAVSKVQTIDEQVRYVTADELEELKKAGSVKAIDTISDAGQPAVFTGRDLRLRYGFVSHLASDRGEVAAALRLGDQPLEEDPSLGGKWKPVLVRLDGPIRNDKVNFIIRTLDQRLGEGDVNFVCIEIDSAGGSLTDSVRLAQYLADLDSRSVRTVAFVPRHARGDAVLVAAACDHLVVTENARLGGPGETNFDPRFEDDLRVAVQAITEPQQRHWSLPLALVNPHARIGRYVHEQDQRVAFLTDEELQEQEDSAHWKKSSDLAVEDGITGREADEYKLARFVVDNYDQLKQIYHLDSEPERLHANWAHLLIEQLARPEISGFLLFIAFFTLCIEMMTPGVGLPGFIAAVCFLLFFWANVLHGTAGTLEIVLFVAGIAFVALELFAMPGFGVFGVGGVLLIISSVILASQTFVIPRNAYQLEQLPNGLMMVTAAGAGVIISLIVFRKYLHKAPLVNRMMLQPPEGDQLNELSRREALATFDHLVHKRGVTITPLTPAGKARFGDEYVDVISDGDFLPRDADVYVIEATGNRVVVKRIE